MPSLRLLLNPRVAWRHFAEHVRFRYMPRIARALLSASTRRARLTLGPEPIAVLLDSNIHHHAITHETGWISTGPKMWGGQPLDTGYMARVPVHRRDSDKAVYQDIKYLPGLIHLARQGYLRLLTSAELEAEREGQPNSRFAATGWFDYSLLSRSDIESVDGEVWGRTLLSASFYGEQLSPQEAQRKRLADSHDVLFRSLLDALGPSNSQDAWHVRTAEVHGVPYFLTMDWKLIGALKAQSGRSVIKLLKTRVLTPTDLGKILGLMPFPPVLLSYNDASFFVRADLHMPDERRRQTGKAATKR